MGLVAIGSTFDDFHCSGALHESVTGRDGEPIERLVSCSQFEFMSEQAVRCRDNINSGSKSMVLRFEIEDVVVHECTTNMCVLETRRIAAIERLEVEEVHSPVELVV